MVRKESPFMIFKNFDITTMGKYTLLEYQNLELLRKKFKLVEEESTFINYLKENNIQDRHAAKAFWLKGRSNAFNDFRTTYLLSNDDNEVPSRFQLQCETRKVLGTNILLFLDFPITEFSKYIRSTESGLFDYDIALSFFSKMDEIGWTKNNFHNLKTEYNNLYPDKEPGYNSYIWNFALVPEQYYSFKTYGQLNIPVLDRDYSIFIGSSGTLFHSSVVGFTHIPLFLKIPEDGRGGLKSKWFVHTPLKIFNNEMFFVFYIDIEEQRVAIKKFNTDEYKLIVDNIKDLDKIVDIDKFIQII